MRPVMNPMWMTGLWPLLVLAGCAPEMADTGDTQDTAALQGAATGGAAGGAEAGGASPLNLRDPAALQLLEPLGRGQSLEPMTVDSTAPTGTVVVNGGAAWARSASVTLTLEATDDTAVTEMCVSNTSSCTTWVAYATGRAWSLTAGAGSRTVYAYFRDEAGNVSAAATDGIGLDGVAPLNGSVTATPTAGQVELSWSGYSDALSGVDSYRVMYAAGTTPTAACRSGTTGYEGSAGSAVITGLTDGTTYNFIVCAIDSAGNVSNGTRLTTRPAPEFNAPTGGSVLVNAGATWSGSSRVSLEIAATDDTAVSQMCISTSTRCTSWIAYATTATFTINGTGTQTVSVWFRDPYNNVTAAPSTDTIIVDKTKPVNGAAAASGASGEVTLSWSGFSDALSGIASYKVVRAIGTTAPTSCATGTLVYQGADTGYVDTGLTDGTTYTWRVCAVDNAGNVSTGARTTGRPAPEYNLPTGTVLINGGDIYTRTTATTLTISATDDSDVTHMCISNTTRCTTWIAFSESRSWTISGGVGDRRVYVSLRDIYGNVSAAVTDTILIDNRGPTGGAVVATTASGTAVDLVGSGFSDALSGVASYKAVYAAGSRAPATCNTGTVGYTGADPSGRVSGLSVNTLYSFRLCAIDAVGNLSAGVTASATTLAEGDPPVIDALALDGGAEWSTDADVDVSISATDVSGVSLMCLSDTEECPAWEPYATETSWTFDGEEGPHTLYVWLEDSIGNASSEPATAGIIIDLSAPIDGSVDAAQDGDGAADLSWSGFTDAWSDIASYNVQHHADGHLPSDCADGDTVYSGAATSTSLSALTNGIGHHFLVCATDSAGHTSSGASASVFLYDTTPPVPGALTINGGAASTNSATVTVTATATDGGGLADVCLSNTDQACSDWQPYGTTMTWTLESGEGDRTVYAYFRDQTGNVSESSASSSILVDQTAPADGSADLTPDDATVLLEWSGFEDEQGGSGLAAYWVVYAEGDTAPADCDSGEVAYTGTDTSVTVDGLTNGTRYAFRLCAEDSAGNMSAGLTGTARPAPEFDAPVGTVSVAAGAAWIGGGAAAITLSATDDSAVSLMCLGESPDACTGWVAYSTSATWTFPAVEGTHTLYAWFEDEYYNTTVTPVSDSVYKDLTAPAQTAAAASATATGDNSATVSWSGFTDATAGISSYTVVYARTTAPANCSSGTTGYTGTAASASITGLLGGSTYYFRVCATDAVGNTSAGVTTSAVTPDTTRPTGTVSINSGAIGTSTTAVTLSFSPVDDSAISTMCISNTSAACTTFVAYTATKAHTLVTGAGVKTVYVYLRDAAGNTSLALTDTIIVDTTAPTNGTVTSTTATAGQIGLSWVNFTDTGSGVASYKVVYAAGTTAPANCTTAGTVLYTGTSTSVTHTGLVRGAKYSYRVCAINNANSTSTGTAKTNLTVL